MQVESRYSLLAACMMHVEGYYSTKSPAYIHHNPGNIMQFPAPGQHVLRTYDTIQDGYDALVQDIQANVGKPLNAFIAKYAPPNENNTSMYLQVVSTLSGIAPDESL